MDIYFGNLSVSDIEKEYNVKFNELDEEWLNEHRQANVKYDLAEDKWHCFDFPRVIGVGSENFRNELFNRLKDYPFNGQIGIAVFDKEREELE